MFEKICRSADFFLSLGVGSPTGRGLLEMAMKLERERELHHSMKFWLVHRDSPFLDDYQ